MEEAIVYCLTTEQRGLSVPQLAYLINREGLHKRADGQPVSENQVWACYFRNRSIFIWEGGIIHLIM